MYLKIAPSFIMLSGPLTYGSKTLKAQGKPLVRVNQKGTLQVERGGKPACGVWCAGCSCWQDFPGTSLPGLMFPGRIMKSDALAGDRHPDNYKPLFLPSSLTMSSSLPFRILALRPCRTNREVHIRFHHLNTPL